MEDQKDMDYDRIARAIEYLKTHFKLQPSLEEVAEKVHVSPFHFQRMFKEWAGVSPKQFLQYLTAEYAKSVLKDKQLTVAEAVHETGLSSSSRLHDLFIKMEGMTPAEFKNHGENLLIHYSFADSPFGKLITASTGKGICYMAFAEEEYEALSELRNKFPRATYQSGLDDFQKSALAIFNKDWRKLPEIKLHVKGTPFQLKVWEALLKIPMGQLATYASLAAELNNEKACRAVGTAVGDNPVAYLIPCHRVIRSTGEFGQYHWGSIRKTAMIGWEVARATDFKDLE